MNIKVKYIPSEVHFKKIPSSIYLLEVKSYD